MNLLGNPTLRLSNGRPACALRLFCLFALTLFFNCNVNAKSDSDEAMTLLAKMSESLRERDYRGIVTYEYGGSLKSMRITHQVTAGLEYEYLEHLNGPPIRIERSGESIECLPKADRVLRGLLPEVEGNRLDLNQHYQFYIGSDVRIAERMATVLQIAPRDQYRYGYSISIDKETGLPLAAVTINGANRVIERLQFTTLELIAEDDWIGSVDASTNVSRPAWPTCSNSNADQQWGWKVTWLPSGFVPAGHSSVEGAGDVMLFTDGLSAFSVFVRPFEKELAAQGKAQRGATVAYMKQQLLGTIPYTITVVGEIPARTAQRIAASIISTLVTTKEQGSVAPGANSSSGYTAPADNSKESIATTNELGS